MKKIFLLLLAAAAVFLAGGCCCSAPADAPAVVLKKGSAVRIVVPAKHANPGMERFLNDCARLVQRALKETIGVRAPIQAEGKVKKFTGTTIYLGNTEALRSYGIDVTAYPGFDSIIAVRDGNIFAAGNDRHRFGVKTRVRGNHECMLGTVMATIELIEKYFDGKFLLPGPDGLDLVAKKSIAFPGKLTAYNKKRMIFGSGRANELFYDYSTANSGRGSFHVYGGHSYYNAVPAKKYAKTNPEYFTYRNGTRSALGNHLCISNKEVQELIYKEMLLQLDKGAETVELAQTDGYNPCLCKECLAYGVPGNDFGEKTWILHRSLAERLMKDRPGKKVLIICYPPNFDPPKTFNKFPENTMIELCKYSKEAFEAWKKITVPQGFLVYIYNWGDYQLTGYTPKVTPKFVAEQAKLFVENGVRGVYRCGFGELCGLEGPVYYTYGKMLENPELSPEALTTEYYKRAYHESFGPMRSFFDELHHGLQLAVWMKEARYTGKQMELLGAIYTPQRIGNLENNLSRAEKIAKQPKVKKRLALVRAEFDYLKAICRVIEMYRAYRTNPGWTTFNMLDKALQDRKANVMKLTPKGFAQPLKAFPAVRFFDRAPRKNLTDNGRASVLGSPFNWNMKNLRDKKILPGTSMKRLTVVPLKGKAEFNKFTTGAWKNVKWNTLGGIQLGPISDKTSFKIAYDEKNLYIALVSDLDPKKQFSPLGADGPCWRNDCIEILLNPQGMRQKYYHMIYTPVTNSFYDQAFGLHEDPLHPKFQKADSDWNGKWSYKTRREGAKWYSLFTVPFSTLDTVKPAPGTVWTMNIGRENRIIGGSGNEPPELSLWSPSLESMGFHDREAFGEAVFQ